MAVLAVATAVFAESAAAAGTPRGAVTLNPTTGQAVQTASAAGAGDTSFAVGLPSLTQYCSGNATSTTAYAAARYIAGASIDPTQINFATFGVPSGTGPTFLSPLYKVNGQSEAQVATGAAPAYVPTAAQDSLWKLADNANLTDGVYRIGLLCWNLDNSTIDGTPGGTANYWESTITISNHTVSSVGNGSFDWAFGGTLGSTQAAPEPPLLASPLTAGDGSLSGSFSQPVTASPAISKWTITAHPPSGSDVIVDNIATAGSFSVSGLTNGVTYEVSVTATNSIATSLPSNKVSGTPAAVVTPPPPYAAPTLTATPAVTSVVLTWTVPVGDSGRTGYTIASPTASGFPVTVAAGATTYTVSGLTAGISYGFTITATYPSPYSGTTSNPAVATPLPETVPPPPSSLTPVAPNRVFDTRVGQPQGAVTVTKGKIGGDTKFLKVKVTGQSGVPETGVGAVSLNVTAISPDGPGYVTVYPCGTRPVASNLNYVAGQIAANLVIAPVPADGSLCFYSYANTDLVADVSGWFPAGTGLNSVTPNRVFDTRVGQPQGAVTITKGKIGGDTKVLRVKVTGQSAVPATGVGAVALNVTAVYPDGPGYVTVYPCGTRSGSNLNYVAGQIVANSVLAPVAADGTVCFFSYANADLVADVSGWFAAGTGFTSVTPNRVFDTRADQPQGSVTVTKVKVGGDTTVLTVKMTGQSGVPATGVGAVSLNVTAIYPDGPGYVTVYPCGTRPGSSNLNYVTGQIVPNSVIAPVSADGTVCFYSYANTDLIADISGWFSA
jgi:hypothetical protein